MVKLVQSHLADPLLRLIRFLGEGKEPDAQWVSEMRRAGEDPVETAWNVTASPEAMMVLLVFLQRYDDYEKISKALEMKVVPQMPWREWLNGVEEECFGAFFGASKGSIAAAVRMIRSSVKPAPSSQELSMREKH